MQQEEVVAPSMSIVMTLTWQATCTVKVEVEQAMEGVEQEEELMFSLNLDFMKVDMSLQMVILNINRLSILVFIALASKKHCIFCLFMCQFWETNIFLQLS